MGAAAPAAAALPLVGGVVGAYGAGVSAKAQQNYYAFQAKAAGQEAGLVDATAKAEQGATTLAASEQSATSARAAKSAEGAAVAQAAASGNVSGANQEAIQKTDITRENLDQMAIRYNADMANYSTGRNALYRKWDLMNQQSQDQYAENVAGVTGTINQATSLLGAATQSADNFARYKGYK